jgi:UDP-N-acetylglucosamine--N-acetylmuramyl-(pentapeptide) pyrophosphoryl-undecaprenol N-acetylglucosamine transferase
MRIVLTGGGTGGHIYPGLTLWRYMASQLPNVEVLYIGSEKGLEKQIVGHEGIAFQAVPAAGLKRQISLSALRTMVTTYRGYRKAKHLIAKFRPDVVVGTGGYVTLPVVYAAHAKNVPSVVWEGNARPGLTNVLCAKRASAVALSFADSEKWFKQAKVVKMIGNPRASEVLDVSEDMMRGARDAYGIRTDAKLIVFFAGSRGAETVNRVLLEMLPQFVNRPQWQLIYVTGEKHFDSVQRSMSDCPANVHVVPFIPDMPPVLAQAAAVVTRAGSSTLAEICSLGLASILIPSPYVTANHQEENALRLVNQGAALMLKEAELTPDALWSALERVLDQGEGEALRSAARSLATPHAVEDLYRLVLEVAKTNGSPR